MKIETITTQLLIKEHETEGHHPLEFLCDDDNIWYVKHLLRITEHRLLVFELLGGVVARQLGIATPEVAFVQISPDSYERKSIKRNKWLRPDSIGFGSKQVPNVDLFTALLVPQSKSDFNQFTNPYDLVRIALLDLWIYNTDRKANNYNLLQQNLPKGKRVYAIDHGKALGGVRDRNPIPSLRIDTDETLISSPFMNAMLPHMERKRIVEYIESFFYFCKHESPTTVLNVFTLLPAQWRIDPALQRQVGNFLFNAERLERLQQLATDILLTRKLL